jgi:hypothetical protein
MVDHVGLDLLIRRCCRLEQIEMIARLIKEGRRKRQLVDRGPVPPDPEHGC